jgi:hypothetical protein
VEPKSGLSSNNISGSIIKHLGDRDPLPLDRAIARGIPERLSKSTIIYNLFHFATPLAISLGQVLIAKDSPSPHLQSYLISLALVVLGSRTRRRKILNEISLNILPLLQFVPAGWGRSNDLRNVKCGFFLNSLPLINAAFCFTFGDRYRNICQKCANSFGNSLDFQVIATIS